MNIMRITTAAAVALFVTACAAPPSVAPEPPRDGGQAPQDSDAIAEYYIDVEVSGGRAVIRTNSSCKDDAGVVVPDCVEVAKPDYAKFIFTLVDLDQAEDDDQAWRFAGLAICRAGEKDMAGCGLTKPQRLEFVATAPGNKRMLLPGRQGRINLTLIDKELDLFHLWDMNNLRRQFEYGILVCPVGEEPPQQPDPQLGWSPCLVADPRIKNLGRGWN